MIGKYLAALAVSGILTVALPISAGIQDSNAVELAGADEEDAVTIDQLLESGWVKLPAPYLKIAETEPTLSAKPVKQPLTRPNPELQLEKQIAKSAPKPEENLVEPTETEVVREPKPVEPVKKAAEIVPKEELTETLDVKKKVVSEPDQSSIAAPYVRMDVGYGLVLKPEGMTTAGDMTGEDVANLAIFGAGVGYRFSENLRVDLNADYRADAVVAATTPSGATVRSEVNGLTVMLNGYHDIGTFAAFIPYVGGGVGFTRLKTAKQTGVSAFGDTSTNFAWALSLGSAIDVGSGDNTMVDVGYRLVSLGEFKQRDGTTYDELMVHEFRAGFRHNF